jgi:hypothetical protein
MGVNTRWLYAYTCKSHDLHEAMSGDKAVTFYRVSWPPHLDFDTHPNAGWHCICKGQAQNWLDARSMDYCEHVKAVLGTRCKWNRFLDPELRPVKREDGLHSCPDCGGEVVVYFSKRIDNYKPKRRESDEKDRTGGQEWERRDQA